MFSRVAILLGVVSLALGVEVPGVKTTEKYSQAEILDSDSNYIMFWNYNDTHVTFEVHVKTRGWVGLGLSGNGNMFPGDVVIGWVADDGTAHLSDRHTAGHYQPIKDKSQDWHLLHGEENEFGTLLKFVRRINTCDKAEDEVIPQGTSRMIYAYGTADPTSNETITYHGQTRGTKSVALLSTIHVPKNFPTNLKRYDFLNQNFVVPATDTTYWCIGFQMPDIGGKHHMIKYEPIITPGNEMHVHHILLYRCKGIDPTVSDGAKGNCYHGRPNNLPKCSSMLLAWAIGGQTFYFPDHVGFSFGAHDDATFYIMETHYDNPAKQAGIIDNSGIRITLTETLRPQEAGLLEIGVSVNHFQIVPPFQEAFVSKGYCSADCLKQGMAAQNIPEIKMISAFQHSHLLGVAIETRHFRNGTELEPLITDPHYDFDFQETRVLPKERHVYPGDSFRVDCTYDSRKRSYVTFGGLTTRDEMCLTFVYYYPRMPAVNCISQVTYDNFHVQRNEIVNYVSHANWTNKTLVQQFEAQMKESTHHHSCHGDGFHFSGNKDFKEMDNQTPYVPPPPVCN